MSNNEVSLSPGGELRILFDKDSGDITIVSLLGNSIVFNDSNKELIITDINSNSIRMAPEGITISSVNNIAIHSDQTVSIKGNTGVNIQATEGNMSVDAMNIKETAQVEYTALGSASAKVEGGAQLTLKGAMVMIN